MPRTGIWQPDPLRAPKMSMRSLWSGAREAQKKVLASSDLGQWSEDDKELWDLTVLEEQAGNLAGPYTAEEISAQVGKLWVAARRFSIRQGEKLPPSTISLSLV